MNFFILIPLYLIELGLTTREHKIFKLIPFFFGPFFLGMYWFGFKYTHHPNLWALLLWSSPYLWMLKDFILAKIEHQHLNEYAERYDASASLENDKHQYIP